MRKGVLQFAVMLIIAKRAAYTSEIIKFLTEHDLLVVEGTLYPLLNRLTKLGLVSYDWEESTGGPPRKYYSITASGKETLRSLEQEWKNLESSINSLVDSK